LLFHTLRKTENVNMTTDLNRLMIIASGTLHIKVKLIRENEVNKMGPPPKIFGLMAIPYKMYSPLQTHVVMVLLKREPFAEPIAGDIHKRSGGWLESLHQFIAPGMELNFFLNDHLRRIEFTFTFRSAGACGTLEVCVRAKSEDPTASVGRSHGCEIRTVSSVFGESQQVEIRVTTAGVGGTRVLLCSWAEWAQVPRDLYGGQGTRKQVKNKRNI
jgi:hypothetical protein